MDKSWIDLPNRMSSEYINGIDEFLVFAYTNMVEGSVVRGESVRIDTILYERVYGSI